MRSRLNERIRILNSLEATDSDDVHLLGSKIAVLKDIALLLVDEIESIGAVRVLNLSRGISLPDEVRAFEIHLIQSALERTGGHQTRAAQMLGINLTTLHNKVKRLDIDLDLLVDAPVIHEDSFYSQPENEEPVN